MKNARRKSLYTLVAAALLGVLVMPLAFAGAAKGPSTNGAHGADQEAQQPDHGS